MKILFSDLLKCSTMNAEFRTDYCGYNSSKGRKQRKTRKSDKLNENYMIKARTVAGLFIFRHDKSSLLNTYNYKFVITTRFVIPYYFSYNSSFPHLTREDKKTHLNKICYVLSPKYIQNTTAKL